MKIAVCLPSLNEANNIQDITRIVDRGLRTFSVRHPDLHAEIVNVDSNSTDGTAKLFLETKTDFLKRSIVITEAAGKGNNILKFCEYAISNDVDFCLTIDTDITSMRPDWVTTLLAPLANEGATYVTPIYKRSRFESSSTNHFSFPLVYALFGQTIRQPIAGDFAFTREVAQALAGSSLGTHKSIRRYGIDIFMTITAIGTGGVVAQVDLGKKIHSPSFNKLEYMFPQIATATLLTSNTVPTTNNVPKQKNTKINILSNVNFAHRENAKIMRTNALNILKPYKNNDWISAELTQKFLDTAEKDFISHEDSVLTSWTDLLTCWINHFLRPSLSTEEAERAGNELLPFFELRATNFWFWAETVDVATVEATITRQADILRNKLSKDKLHVLRK